LKPRESKGVEFVFVVVNSRSRSRSRSRIQGQGQGQGSSFKIGFFGVFCLEETTGIGCVCFGLRKVQLE